MRSWYCVLVRCFVLMIQLHRNSKENKVNSYQNSIKNENNEGSCAPNNKGKRLHSFLSKGTFFCERFDYYALITWLFLVCSPESFLVSWIRGGRWWDLILNKKVLLHH